MFYTVLSSEILFAKKWTCQPDRCEIACFWFQSKTLSNGSWRKDTWWKRNKRSVGPKTRPLRPRKIMENCQKFNLTTFNPSSGLSFLTESAQNCQLGQRTPIAPGSSDLCRVRVRPGNSSCGGWVNSNLIQRSLVQKIIENQTVWCSNFETNYNGMHWHCIERPASFLTHCSHLRFSSLKLFAFLDFTIFCQGPRFLLFFVCKITKTLWPWKNRKESPEMWQDVIQCQNAGHSAEIQRKLCDCS